MNYIHEAIIKRRRTEVECCKKRNLSCDDMISDFIAYFIMQALMSNKTNNKTCLPLPSNASGNKLT